MPRILGFLLVLPVLELIAFIAVAAVIGFGKAVLLQLAISLIGAAMLGSLVSEARARMRGGAGVMTLALDREHGMRGLAGLLFAMPGFLTDALGVMTLVPEVRNRLHRLLTGGRGAPQPRATQRRAPADGVIELDRREWRETREADRPSA